MKLPELNYSAVSVPRGTGSEAAIAKGNAIIRGTQILETGLKAIDESMREYNTVQATVRAQNRVTQVETENAGKDFYTPDEVRTLGLDDRVEMNTTDSEGNAVPVEFIPREQVYPLLMDRTLDEAISMNVDVVKNKQDRDQWLQGMSTKKEEAMLKVYTDSRAQAMERAHKKMEVEIVQAQASGNFEGAAALISARYKDPALRQEALDENAVAGEDAKYNEVIMKYDADAILAEAQALKAKDLKDTPYNSDQRAAQVSALERAANNKKLDAETRDKAQMDRWQEGNLAALQNNINSNQPGALTWADDFYPLTTSPLADESYISKINTMYNNYITTGSPYAKHSDLATVTELRNMIDNPATPLKEMQTYLVENSGKLNETDAKALEQKIRETSNPETQPGALSATQRSNARLVAMGYNPGQSKDQKQAKIVAGFQSSVDNALLVAKASNGGKPLSQDQINSVVDSVYMNVKPRELSLGTWSFNKSGDNVFEMIESEEGDNYGAALLTIEQMIRNQPGALFTPDDYAAAYARYKKGTLK